MKIIIAVLVPIILVIGGITLALYHVEGWGWPVFLGAIVYLTKDVSITFDDTKK